MNAFEYCHSQVGKILTGITGSSCIKVMRNLEDEKQKKKNLITRHTL